MRTLLVGFATCALSFVARADDAEVGLNEIAYKLARTIPGALLGMEFSAGLDDKIRASAIDGISKGSIEALIRIVAENTDYQVRYSGNRILITPKPNSAKHSTPLSEVATSLNVKGESFPVRDAVTSVRASDSLFLRVQHTSDFDGDKKIVLLSNFSDRKFSDILFAVAEAAGAAGWQIDHLFYEKDVPSNLSVEGDINFIRRSNISSY